MADLYSDIYKYLDDYGAESVSFSEGLEDLIGLVRAHTGISEEKAKIIIDIFIIEIRNAMLRGEIVCLSGFGDLYCYGKHIQKHNRKRKHKIHPLFKASKTLHKKINKNGNTE
jgi:nucleoid DNA-binding protein